MCSLFSSKYAIALALVGHEAALVALLPLALQVHRHIGGDDGLDVVGLRQASSMLATRFVSSVWNKGLNASWILRRSLFKRIFKPAGSGAYYAASRFVFSIDGLIVVWYKIIEERGFGRYGRTGGGQVIGSCLRRGVLKNSRGICITVNVGTLSIRNRVVTTCYFYAFKAGSFGAGMHHKAERHQRPMAATTIPRIYF